MKVGWDYQSQYVEKMFQITNQMRQWLCGVSRSLWRIRPSKNATRGPWTCPWDGMGFQHFETPSGSLGQTWLAGKLDPFFSLSCPLTPPFTSGISMDSHCRIFLLPPRSPRQWEIAPLPHDQHPIWRGELGFASRWRTWGNSNHRRTQKAPKKMRETCVQLIQDLKGSGKTEDITLCFAKQKKSPPATSKWTCRIIWSVDNVGYSRCFLCCIHSASTRNHGPSLFDPKPKIETWKLFNVLYSSVFNYSGWWLTYPSEKYESQLGWFFPTEWKKHCSKKKFQTTNQYLLWKTFIKILWTPLWHMEMTW